MLREFAQYSKETLLGVMLSLGTALVLGLLPGLMRLDASAMLLVLIAAIYIGFALTDERPDIVRLRLLLPQYLLHWPCSVCGFIRWRW